MMVDKIVGCLKKIKHRNGYILARIKEIIASALFSKFKIQNNKIVFDNFVGKGYGDNPKYIAEELLKKDCDLDLVWVVNNKSEKIQKGIRTVKYGSVRALYEFATAKVWIDNVRNTYRPNKRKNQVYIQTWHAPFSPKCVERDAEKFLSKEYIQKARYDGEITTGILVNSRLQEEQFRRAFWLSSECEILRYGLPRNDALINKRNDLNLKKRVRDFFDIKENDYVVLYAPTFRDDYSTEGYQIEFNKVCSAFSKRMGKRCRVIVRLHPNAAFQKAEIRFSLYVIDGTNYPDIQELSLACDAIISDYSTSIFDFALIGKPAFICALDLKKYENSRGLLKEFYSFPFPMAMTNKELLSQIESFDEKKYNEKVAKYFQNYPFYDKGNAAERTVQWIIDRMSL